MVTDNADAGVPLAFVPIAITDSQLRLTRGGHSAPRTGSAASLTETINPEIKT